jgi:catechol 2,3-dioxygenase-like lactoylglutathione lyase family enzyme
MRADLADVTHGETVEMGGMKIHHTAICIRDIDASKRFWRDGLGFIEQMDNSSDGDWPTLFNARQTRLGSIFLGDPNVQDARLIELVEFAGGIDEAGEPPREPTLGFFLVSVYLAVDPTLARLDTLDLGGRPTRITLPGGVQMAVVRDLNGVAVELIELAGD